MVVIAVVIVVFVFFGVFLGGVKVYNSPERARRRWQSPLLDQLVLHKKQLVQILTDLLLLSAAYTAAWLLRFEGSLGPEQMNLLTVSLPWVLAAKILFLWLFGVYRGEWRYVSVHAMIQLSKASLAGSLVVVGGTLLLRDQGYSLSAAIIDFFVSFFFLAGSRSLVRVFTESIMHKEGEPVLIMGAGDGGELLLRELRNNPALPYVPVAFVDDDPAKRGLVIHGIPVLGTRHDIAELADKYEATRVIISILSPVDGGLEEVFAICRRAGLECVRVQPIVEQELEHTA